MSSPIHKLLFSPPTSPRLLPTRLATPDPNKPFTALCALLPPHMVGSPKPRSPRTPQTAFTLDGAGAFSTPSASYPTRSALPIDATPVATPTITTTDATPKATPGKAEGVAVPTAAAAASAASAIAHGLPKPVLRLALLVSLLLSSVALLTFVPGARLPSLRAASMSRRVALDTSGRAAYDVAAEVRGLAVADRDYVPPQVRSRRITRRLLEADGEAAAEVARAVVEQAAPRSNGALLSSAARGAPGPAQLFGMKHPRPLPPTHELAALQSFVLGSAYNVLPPSTDGSAPLDATAVLGHLPRLGPVGSPAEQAWLDDIAAEHADDVVVWYGADGSAAPPAFVLDLLAEFTDRQPTLVPCHARPDLAALRAVFSRLALDLDAAPVLFIGNEPVAADRETLVELVASGELPAMLRRAGWARSEARRERRTLKQATLKRREMAEVEAALA